jgi:eukaryotic-like serine/threonine-protein kinase
MQDPSPPARDVGKSGSAPFVPHTCVLHYELIAELGRGGMGVVYRARDKKLERMVALKRPWPKQIAEPAQRRRFLREARAAAQISHPNVVPVFEVFEHDGIPWIVMELVDGISLRSLLRGFGALPLEDILRHAEGLADALAAAHSRSILHRDVNPNNILVDSSGRAMLTDFGLAQFVASPIGEDASTVSRSVDLTDEKRLVGTPGYTSPEQAQGQPLDGRSDLFSLGAVVYEMCTGGRAFAGRTPAELLHAVVHDAPLEISSSPRLPESLVRIVRKALAKRPDERYQTAQDLLADLRALRRQVEFEEHARLHPIRAPRRPRWWPAGAATLAAVIVAGAAVARFVMQPGGAPASRAAPPVSLLIADFENDTGEAVFDRTLAEGLGIALSQSRHLTVLPRERVVDVLRRMKRAPDSRIDVGTGREICRRESLTALLDGSIRRSGNVFQIRAQAIEPASGKVMFAESEQFEAKDHLFGRVDALARRVRQDLGESGARIQETGRPLEKATTHSLDALQLFSRARQLKAIGERAPAAKLLKAALQIDPDFAMAHLYLGDILGGDGEIATAREHIERAYALRDDLTGLERQYVEADYHEILNDFDKALASLEVLVSLYPSDLRGHRRLAAAYDNAGNLKGAIRELRVALQLDPMDGEGYGHLALALVAADSPNEALAAIDEARKKGLAVPDFHRSGGLARLSLGQIERAREEFRFLEGAGPSYVNIGQLYRARAALYEGKLAEAEELLTKGIRREAEENNQVYKVLRRNLRARVRWLAGNERGAREDLAHAGAVDDRTFGAYQLLWAARIWVEMGDTREARRVLDALRRLIGATPDAYDRACLRIVEGEIALADRDPAKARDSFLAATAESRIYESHRGLARVYRAQRDWKRAAEAWQQVLAARSRILRTGDPSDLAVARLELGREYRRLGDLVSARNSYDGLLQIWRDADDLPLRRIAMKESRELGATPSH